MEYGIVSTTHSSTLKLRTPQSEAALYLSIGYELRNGKKWPVEIFINSKDIKYFQFISCILRMLSAVLRRSEDFPWYAINELIETFDPAGGYVIPKSGGVRANGLVSHVGILLKQHCIQDLGLEE